MKEVGGAFNLGENMDTSDKLNTIFLIQIEIFLKKLNKKTKQHLAFYKPFFAFQFSKQKK